MLSKSASSSTRATRELYIERVSKAFVGGRNGSVHGFLLDHLLAQDIVDIDTSGPTWIAKMRLRTLMSAGTHESMGDNVVRGQRQWWEGGSVTYILFVLFCFLRCQLLSHETDG